MEWHILRGTVISSCKSTKKAQPKENSLPKTVLFPSVVTFTSLSDHILYKQLVEPSQNSVVERSRNYKILTTPSSVTSMMSPVFTVSRNSFPSWSMAIRFEFSQTTDKITPAPARESMCSENNKQEGFIPMEQIT